MYQTDFLCTYKLMSDLSYQDELYKIQLLQAFDLEQWNDDKVHEIIENIYSLMKNTNEMKQIIEKSKKNDNINTLLNNFNKSGNNDEYTIFTILFNFSTFDLLHRVIIDFLRNKKIEEIHLNKLLKAL